MRKGFTMIELTMVMVIIALVIGGVLAGKELVEAARVAKQIKQLSDINTAAGVFRSKYNAIPGDFARAYNYFRIETIDPNTGLHTGEQRCIDASECNGDGNGKVDAYWERYNFWQHLAWAGILRYNPAEDTGGYNSGVFENSLVSVTREPYDSKARNAYMIGGLHTYGSDCVGFCAAPDVTNETGVFTPAIAQKFDEKLDDGNPITGTVTVVAGFESSSPGGAYSSSTSCAQGASAVSDPWYTNNHPIAIEDEDIPADDVVEDGDGSSSGGDDGGGDDSGESPSPYTNGAPNEKGYFVEELNKSCLLYVVTSF